MINSFSIHSQTISSTESRKITYNKLGEFAKYVKYKEQTDTLLPIYLKELSLKDSLLSIKDKKLFQYEFSVIPSYKSRIAIKDSTINNHQKIFTIKEDMYTSEIKRQKGKKWQWLGGGTLISVLLT